MSTLFFKNFIISDSVTISCFFCLFSACILGTSAPVSAADLSSELFSADDITDTEAPADTSQDQPAATDETSSPDSTDTLKKASR